MHSNWKRIELKSEKSAWREGFYPYPICVHLFVILSTIPSPTTPSPLVETRVEKKRNKSHSIYVYCSYITIAQTEISFTDMQEPYAIAVLLQNDLVLIDLLSPGYPCFESPYPMDIHESPVTCCTYLADCPSDLVPAFYMVGLSEYLNFYLLFARRPYRPLFALARCRFNPSTPTGGRSESVAKCFRCD